MKSWLLAALAWLVVSTMSGAAHAAVFWVSNFTMAGSVRCARRSWT